MQHASLSHSVPLPARALLEKLKVPALQGAPHEVLRDVSANHQVLQEFRPLAQALESDLANLYWTTRGTSPFVENEVPYLINNSGRASEDAAIVFFANCLEAAPPSGPLHVLELGAGIGLFARYFLDAFRLLCEQEKRDYYQRLLYLASDRSPSSVAQWQEQGLFADHAGHVIVGVCEALDPAGFRDLAGQAPNAAALQAVFANYVLDVLPAAIVRTGPRGPEQLCVRTHLTTHAPLLPQYCRLSPEEVRLRAASDQVQDRAELLPLLTLLEFETAFLPVGGEQPPYLEEALAFGQGLARVLLNHGALASLEASLRLLSKNGFILLNDYGPVERAQVAEQAATQRFGSSTAVGINFPFLEHHFAKAGRIVHRPEGDEKQSIHARLVLTEDLPGTRAAFANRFAGSAREYFTQPVDEARQHAGGGRQNEALDSYRTALTRSPRDWCLIGEAAEYVALQLRDFQAGLELVGAAIELNPTCSTWLWNVLGDCLFCLERFDQAHESYLQAQRINARDVRTHFNLSYTYYQRGLHLESLQAIARALANDHTRAYRERLLDKQQQVLASLSGRWLAEQERLLKRAGAFT